MALELIIAYPVYYFFRGESFYSASSKIDAFLFEADNYVGYRLAPNIDRKQPPFYDSKKAPRRAVFYDFQTSAQGFRYKENIPLNKNAGEIRVFSLGGSTTQGAESPNSSTYPQLLENMLRKEIGMVTVVNAGVGGYRSIHLRRYYEKFVAKYQPDVITIYEGWNDFDDSMYGYWKPGDPFGHALSTQFFLYGPQSDGWLRMFRRSALFSAFAKAYFTLANKNRVETGETAPRSFLESARSSRWIDEYYNNISALVKQAIADGVIPVLINPASPVFEGATDEIKRFADEDLNMSGRWDGFVIVRNGIYETNSRIAKENDIPLIELNKIVDGYNQDYRLKFSFFTDKYHLTNEGNAVVANALAPQLLSIIRDRRAKKSAEKQSPAIK